MKLALAFASLLVLSGFATLAAVADAPALPRATRDLDGTVRDAYGLLAAPQEGAPEQAAQRFLREHAAELGIPDLQLLELQHVRHSLAATHLRYAQSAEGLPVVGGDVSIHVRGDGAVVGAHSRAVGRVLPLADSVGSTEATAIAQGAAEGAPVAAEPVVFARGLEGVHAWQVRFHRAAPLSAWVVHVDRASGAILEARETVRAAEAPANVWVNPIVASRNPDLRDNLLGVQQAPMVPMVSGEMDLSPYLTEVTLTNLSEGMDGAILEGEWARIADAAASGSDLRFPREDPRFEEVQAYYWTDWSQQRIRELGFDDVAAYQIPIVLHDQPGVYNAFYSGNGDGTGEMHFGWHAPTAGIVGAIPAPNGLADAAEDAEVVLHEYGHAILDNQVPNFGSGSEGGAIHEGWGDFWSGTQASRVSGGFYDACLGEWFTSYLYVTADGTPPCLRDMDNYLTYDYDHPDGHLTGQIWSGALWNLREELGREAGEMLALEANFLLPVDGGFHDGAEALLMADAMLNDATNARLIVGEFQGRNITNLLVTPELLQQVQDADLRIASQAQPRPVPGAEAALLAVALGLVAVASRRRS